MPLWSSLRIDAGVRANEWGNVMSATFTKEERAAMRATVAEEKAAKAGADLEAACLAAIAGMSGSFLRGAGRNLSFGGSTGAESGG